MSTAIDSQGHVCALNAYSWAHLETSSVSVRDTFASVKFKLSMYINSCVIIIKCDKTQK